jgi:inosine-uridine nucleoside N-ribohydrolase
MNGSNHPDALTMAILIEPRIGQQMLSRYVEVETQGELTRGVLVIDELGVMKKAPNVTICVQADEKLFKEMVFNTLKNI